MDASRPTSIEDLKFDVSALNSENNEASVFQWLSRCEQSLRILPEDDIKAVQSGLEATLISIISAGPPYPVPGRSIRQLLARSFIVLFERAQTRSLFDTLQSLSRTTNDSKSSVQSRICSLFVTGEIMAAFGSQIMSFMGEVTTSTVKLWKQSNTILQIRYHAIRALQRSIPAAGRAIHDATMKDIIKLAKAGLSDKAVVIQKASALTLLAVYQGGRGVVSTSEIETIVSACIRGLEAADHSTRGSFTELVASVLALTQTEVARAVEPSSRKPGKGDADGDDGGDSTVRTAPEAPTPTIMTLQEMLNVLGSWVVRAGTTKKMRAGLVAMYAKLFMAMGASFVESQYPQIVAHLFSDVVSHPRCTATRQDILLIRGLVGTLLRGVVGIRMLSEQGQISAIKALSDGYLRQWPALMPGREPPSSRVLVIALNEVGGLLQQLGNAPPPVQDALASPLLELLSHPSHSVRLTSAWVLKVFCFAAPLRLARSVMNVWDLLQKDLASLLVPNATSNVSQKLLGHSYGLAALVSVISRRPLYVSYDLSAKVLDTAVQLLKRAGEHDIAISGVEIDAAWTCISSLMSLGPNFVRAHLSQLLVLWRNALPKQTSKEIAPMGGRSKGEWEFLLRVRESALSAILNFLAHNSPTLVTLDVARRLSSLLSNALNFVNGFVTQYRNELRETVSAEDQKLMLRESMLRRRVFQCFTALGTPALQESTQISLLESAVALFAGADGAIGSSAQAAIVSSSGNFTSVWNATDGYAYGLTTLEAISLETGSATRDLTDLTLEKMTRLPIFGSLEHDTLSVCEGKSPDTSPRITAMAPTAVVDAAIELFALLLPRQDLPTVERFVKEVIDASKAPRLERNMGRKGAVMVNALSGILLALSSAAQNGRHARATFGASQVNQPLCAFLKDVLLTGDPNVRSLASDAFGRLAGYADATFISNQITSLVELVVANRDSNARAGCSSAFGAIYTHVGGLLTGPLLRTTVNVLMSLSTDPHPTVHYHALMALSQVISASSLSFSPLIASTLVMLIKVYSLDSHEPEGGTLQNINARGDCSVPQIMCQCIDAIIGVLGPELAEPGKTRSLTLDLVNQFFHEVDEETRVQSIRCVQHILIFESEPLLVSALIAHFRSNLSSEERPLKLASINVLYALVQKDAFTLSKLGGDKLVEDLFSMLDDPSSGEGVRGVITSWLQQTVMHGPSAWIDLCQRIMSKSTAFQPSSGATTKTGASGQDDEGEALSVGVAQDQPAVGGAGRASSISRWRTQLFALQCLHLICTTVAQSGLQEHFDLRYARTTKGTEKISLASRIPDLVRMAFSASAAYVTEIRLEGLVVIRDIIEIFSHSPDPDYPEALLLEQYQAPITSALTPAFSSDSTPEILASAIQTCASFIGSGIVKETGRMGRILKLLTSTLQQAEASTTLTIGDAQELSPNASVMLRVAVLAGWADLEVASVSKPYLKDVLNNHRRVLSTLWIASLRDYASIHADSELLQEAPSGSVDLAYTGMGREILLPYYSGSWIKIMHAVACSMMRNDPAILAAMDGQEPSLTASKTPQTEGTSLYPVILGLVFEALAQGTDASLSTSRPSSAVALKTLRSLVRPEYSGNALFEPSTFSELVGLFYRMALTETPDIQGILVDTIISIVTSRDTKTLLRNDPNSGLNDAPITQCLRLCGYIARNAINSKTLLSASSAGAWAVLIRDSLVGFMNIARKLPAAAREDARAIAALLYSVLLKDETSESDLIQPSLPALKVIIDSDNDVDTTNVDDMRCVETLCDFRGREGPVPRLKVKNNLLATVLILTSVPNSLPLSQAVLEHSCFLISEKLGDSQSEIALTAAHCARTLIAASTSGVLSLRPCIRLLVPGLISCIANAAAFLNKGEGRSELDVLQLQAIEEVLKCFQSLFQVTPEGNRARTLAIIMPVLILLLDPTNAPPAPPHTTAVTFLLGYAASSSAAFKEVAGRLDSSQRDILESSIRQAVGGINEQPVAPSVTKKQISLRSF
ncbi:ARM repeat-containing protein [Clavulina sp. PMI_390]|nr:ARM repeat-containing protein [Clavulina sp. PMI_390]